MLSFQVKFVQTDRLTDRRTMSKLCAPDLSILGYKNTSYTHLNSFPCYKILNVSEFTPFANSYDHVPYMVKME